MHAMVHIVKVYCLCQWMMFHCFGTLHNAYSSHWERRERVYYTTLRFGRSHWKNCRSKEKQTMSRAMFPVSASDMMTTDYAEHTASSQKGESTVVKSLAKSLLS